MGTRLKRFSRHRKNLNFVIFVNRKCVKAISSIKTKNFETFFLNIYTGFGYFILVHNGTILKVWVKLINEKQHKTQGYLGKISESHGINVSRGQWVLPENYNYLNPTELLDLCCSMAHFLPLDCGSIVVIV